ncbi:MAG: LysR family transcriptional regulator [Pseudomonadota bacterium]
MDLKQIEYFVQVAELGSFTRASQVMRVAQPAMSRQIRTLELELRQTLFHRNGRGVTLTEAGQRLLAHGRGILQQVARARLDLEDHRSVPAGRLALGLPPSVSRTLTGPLVAAFRERFPNATLTVVEGLSIYILEWLAQGRIDCAVVHPVAASAAVDLKLIVEEPLYLISARGRVRRRGLIGPAVSLAELAERELVIPSRPHSIRMLVETALAGIGLEPRVGLEIESVPAILDLVERAPLSAVLALNALRGSGHERALIAQPIRAQGGPLATQLWLATSTQRPRGRLLELGADLIVEMLQALWQREA